MIKTAHELFSYIKNPTPEKDSNTQFIYRLKKLISLLFISFISSFLLTIISSIIEELGAVNTENHSIGELFDSKSPLYVFLFAVVIVPIIEELIFRAPLTLFKRRKAFKIAYYTLAIIFGFAHISNYEIDTSILLFSPILIAPQLLIGLYLGFIRVRFGLLWAIALHALYNGFLFSLFLIAKDAIT